jgi:lambda repressor-like predicted transcriptional regulator
MTAVTGSRSNGSPAPGLYAYGMSRGRAREPRAPAPTTATGWFYANVLAELKARGWSASELARRVGVNHNALGKIGRGQCPSLDRAAAIAGALGVPLGDLIAERGGKSGGDFKCRGKGC